MSSREPSGQRAEQPSETGTRSRWLWVIALVGGLIALVMILLGLGDLAAARIDWRDFLPVDVLGPENWVEWCIQRAMWWFGIAGLVIVLAAGLATWLGWRATSQAVAPGVPFMVFSRVARLAAGALGLVLWIRGSWMITHPGPHDVGADIGVGLFSGIGIIAIVGSATWGLVDASAKRITWTEALVQSALLVFIGTAIFLLVR